ncbi:MAG TPA: hypothetical protein VGC14_05030, partial [Rhizobium sp.]
MKNAGHTSRSLVWDAGNLVANRAAMGRRACRRFLAALRLASSCVVFGRMRHIGGMAVGSTRAPLLATMSGASTLLLAAAFGAAGLSPAAATTIAPSNNNCITNSSSQVGNEGGLGGTSGGPTDGSGTYSTVAGCDADGNNQTGVTVYGTKAGATGAGAVAVGYNAEAAKWASALGLDSQATATGATALGFSAVASGANAVSIGGAGGNGTTPLTVANSTRATGAGAVAIGANATRGAQANAADSIALGGQSTVAAVATSGIAIGNTATVNGVDGIAFGRSSTAGGAGAVVLGAGATANNANSVALGSGSVTAAAVSTQTGVIDGTTYTFAGGTPTSAVSVGASGNERQIQNVAAGQIGENSTDAINGSQLYATSQAIETLSDTVDANKTHYLSVNGGQTGAGSNYDNDGASGYWSVAIGQTVSASGGQSVAMGNDVQAQGLMSTAIGTATRATGDRSIAVGFDAQALQDSSMAIGLQSRANEYGTAVGTTARAVGQYSSALGSLAHAGGVGAAGFGMGSAIGNGSTAVGGGMVGTLALDPTDPANPNRLSYNAFGRQISYTTDNSDPAQGKFIGTIDGKAFELDLIGSGGDPYDQVAGG